MKKQPKISQPNALNFYEVRRVNILPPYFESISLNFNTYNLEGTIIKWIDNNLKGRYYVGKQTELDLENQFNKIIKIGFENPKELSFFTLACPHLKYK